MGTGTYPIFNMLTGVSDINYLKGLIIIISKSYLGFSAYYEAWFDLSGREAFLLKGFGYSLSYRTTRRLVINLELCAHFVPQAEGQAICNLHFDNLCCRRGGIGSQQHISLLSSCLSFAEESGVIQPAGE